MEAAAKGLAKDRENVPTTDLTGRNIAHDRVEEKIGEGGMGVVYRAAGRHQGVARRIRIAPRASGAVRAPGKDTGASQSSYQVPTGVFSFQSQ